MEIDQYISLLEKARSETPLVIKKGGRFQIPVLRGYIEGSSTVIQNFNEVRRVLNRDENHILLFLCRELGTSYTKKGTVILLHGKFQFSRLNKKLRKYINLYVICPVCERPDTRIIKEKGIHYLKCEACGALTPIKKI